MTAATMTRTLHETLVMERTYNAAPARVFAAWESVDARLRWSLPSPGAGAVYDQADFRVGGLDIMRCGPKDDMRFRADVHYLDIVRDARIVMAERVAESGEFRAASLITIAFAPEGRMTRQTVTLQVCAVEGSGMVAGYRAGWTAALDNLAGDLAANA